VTQQDELLNIVSFVLNVPVNELSDSSGINDFENWDSMRHLVIISEIESHYNIYFKTEELFLLKTIQELRAAIHRSQIE